MTGTYLIHKIQVQWHGLYVDDIFLSYLLLYSSNWADGDCEVPRVGSL